MGVVANEPVKDQEIDKMSLDDIEKSGETAVHAEHTEQNAAWIPNDDSQYEVTFKTWIVASILSLSYGISFWIVPSLSACQAGVATQLGDASKAAWYIPIYTMTVTMAFMICGANSDLFGRRWFIIGGNILMFIGFVVGGSAKNNTSVIVSCALIGFGGGNAQLAAFALPELLPNKWRHSAIVFADIGVYFAVVVGPVAGRFAIQRGGDWRWLFYGPAISVVFSFLGLYLYYHPPRHPRGLPAKQALRELDYVGAILFIVATTLILTGIVYTTTLSSGNPRVIGTLVPGFALLAVFALWETFAPLKQPLTPTRIFTRDHGRELTAPFIAGFVVTMFYYCLNVTYPTMISVFFTDENTDFKYAVVLTLPQNLGLVFGAVLLTLFGSRIGHWRWTLTASVTVMVVFGALLAFATPDRFGMVIAFIFLAEIGFGWAQYLSIAFIQFGTDQVELGISGGLAGVSRFAGGAIAISVYTTILTNVQSTQMGKLVHSAAISAGLPSSSVEQLLAALPLGSAALQEVPGITSEIIAAAGKAFQQSYVAGIRTTCLSSLSFGVIGIIACLCCQDIGHKMNDKIEIFLENEVHADKNNKPPRPEMATYAEKTPDLNSTKSLNTNTNQTSAEGSPTSKGNGSKSALVNKLMLLVEEHSCDQNFPHDILDRARKYIDSDSDSDKDAEQAHVIFAEFEAQKDLMLNNSIYPEVRAVVDPTDDPTLPVGTFRVFLLGTIFAISGTAIHQFFSLRMPSISISTYVVQLLSMPLGVLMAKWLPTRKFHVGRWKFSLNPGPFNQKEHVMIAMMANVSFGGHAVGAYIVAIVQVLKLERFYGETVLANSIPWQIATLLATQLLGYGCAGMVRRFLVYPASMIWQRALANLALTKALYKDNGEIGQTANGWTMSRYKFFVICFVSMFFWYWVPNYLFQSIALFNWPTWISPDNVTLALVAGATCGLGLNPLPTLDWNIATYLGDPIITPLFTLMNFAGGMALMGFIVVPLLYFGNVWKGGYFPINGNRVYDNTGEFYNITRILNPDFTLNETAYYDYSVPLVTTTQMLNYAAAFMLYVALPVHMFLWHRKDIASGLKAFWSRTPREEEFKDVHNRLMAVYPECPQWWYVVILVLSFILACVSVSIWPTGMPIWGVVLAVMFTIILQVPIGMLAAITNMEISTGILAMVIGGYALEGKTIPNMIFKMFSYMSTHQSLNFISDLKLAHYAKISPRWAFAAQVYATFLAGFVALGVNHWVIRNIEDVCQENQRDRFTCPHTHSYFMSSVLWGVVGPRRLFGTEGPYRAITYAIPVGILVPIAVYYISKRWPTSFWRNVNAPILFAGPLGWAPFNWSYMQGVVVLAIVFNFYIKRRYVAWWEKYAYVLTSSFNAAIGVSGLVMFFALQHSNVVLNWWGNKIAHQGVDMGGLVDDQGRRVRCSNLKIPEKGYFDLDFEWKV
ncbi:hypothetical protein FZEAL_1031 [Fusarium zealandicum]|uniref:Major facilitator superfamily (MFS) profile domain-containing protein n=1 Tax=Fusarium zealandicum TaxID=1053134 RepID=A0A8H4UTJ1_9HYPO|nr:hypothetical protein FZEAL_1031 [Fusarium zealandicum]